MDTEHNTVISDRLLDVIRIARAELKDARPAWCKTGSDGRMDALIEQAGDALFAIVNCSDSHGIRKLTNYDVHLDDDTLPRRPIAVELHELRAPAVAAAPEPE